MGGASFLARELGLPLWAHQATAQRLAGAVQITRCLEEGETIRLDGPTPQAWQVLHTPGHAPGHLCLHEAEMGAVVVGDMVASVGTILIEPLDAHADLPGSAAPAEGSRRRSRCLRTGRDRGTERAVAFYVKHRLAREAKVVEAWPGGAAAVARMLVRRAYADTPEALWPLAQMSLMRT